MISLCRKTLELADNKENFSGWVRAMLLREEEANKPNAIRWTYECKECETNFHVTRREYDNFFYCPNMMRGRKDCQNNKPLDGRISQ